MSLQFSNIFVSLLEMYFNSDAKVKVNTTNFSLKKYKTTTKKKPTLLLAEERIGEDGMDCLLSNNAMLYKELLQISQIYFL